MLRCILGRGELSRGCPVQITAIKQCQTWNRPAGHSFKPIGGSRNHEGSGESWIGHSLWGARQTENCLKRWRMADSPQRTVYPQGWTGLSGGKIICLHLSVGYGFIDLPWLKSSGTFWLCKNPTFSQTAILLAIPQKKILRAMWPIAQGVPWQKDSQGSLWDYCSQWQTPMHLGKKSPWTL